MLETAIILAGGFGTRLQSVVADLPKPMADIAGKPFLSYQLNYLKHYGIKRVVFSLGYLSDKIINYYGPVYREMELSYVVESNPLGTGGGIRLAAERATCSAAIVLNGDSFFEIDLIKFFHLHQDSNADVSIALRTVEDCSRYGTIETGNQHNILSFKEKSSLSRPGLINGGVYILNLPLYLKSTLANKSFSIEKDFFEKNISSIVLKGFEFNNYFIDIGVPEDYKKAQHDFKRFSY